VYLRKANVVRRVVLGVSLAPSGRAIVSSLRSSEGPADDSVTAAPGGAQFAEYRPVATYDR
jgi:hypothetical protein